MGLGWGVTVSSHPTRCRGQYRAPCRAWSRGFFPQDEFSLGDLGVHSPQWCLQSPLLTELKISDLVVFFSRNFLSPMQVCLVLPQLSLSQLPKVGSLDQQHQLGTCWKFEFSGLTLELLYCALLCGCQSGVAIGRGTGDTQGNTLIILAASRNRKLASQGGSQRKRSQEVGGAGGRGQHSLYWGFCGESC